MTNAIQLVVVHSLNCLTGLKRKKPVSTLKRMTTNVLSMLFNVEYARFMKKTTRVGLIITKTLMII